MGSKRGNGEGDCARGLAHLCRVRASSSAAPAPPAFGGGGPLVAWHLLSQGAGFTLGVLSPIAVRRLREGLAEYDAQAKAQEGKGKGNSG